MARRAASDLQMTSPGPTAPLKLEDQQRLESSLKATKSTNPCSERLADFKAYRERFWTVNPPPHPHDRRSGFGRGPQYHVSQDGCWVMEVFANVADMCFVTNRYIFNLWTYKHLCERDMHPWVSLNPPNRKQEYNKWEPDEMSVCPDSVEGPSGQFFAKSSPNLHHNVGCHDDESDDEPTADYHCGCSRVAFHTCHVEQEHGLSQGVQVIRASRYADTFDSIGRHWVYVLPSSPLQSVVSNCLPQFKIPRPVIQQIWLFAVSWPAHHAGKPMNFKAMKVHPRWPFNMLRVRRYPRIVEQYCSNHFAIIRRELLEHMTP